MTRRILYGLVAAYCATLMVFDHWTDIHETETDVVLLNIITGIVDVFFVSVGVAEALASSVVPIKRGVEDLFVKWSFLVYLLVNYAAHVVLFSVGRGEFLWWILAETVGVIVVLTLSKRTS